MKFFYVAKTFDEIEKTSSRLEITKLLASLLKEATPQEAAYISYMALGELQPPYQGTKFNFAEKSMYKVLASHLGLSKEAIKKSESMKGDLGTAWQDSCLQESEIDHDLTLMQLYNHLAEFLHISGEGSIERKEKKLSDILGLVAPVSGKYVIRIIVGKLRLGFSDMTLLDAFSWMKEGNKSLRKVLENAYNISVDIGNLVKVLKRDGVDGIKKIEIIPGIPIRPAAAERLGTAKAIIKKLGTCAAQPKIDGFRLQIHKWKEDGTIYVRFFSRNLQEMTGMFPDVQDEVAKIKEETFVIEGEALAYDPETEVFLPFQQTVKRRRKYEITATAEEFPLKLFVFDLLFNKNKSLLDLPHQKRREELKKLLPKKESGFSVIEVIEEKVFDDAHELEAYFHEEISHGLEGLVVKKLDAPYQAGKRNFNWVKFKREETGQLDDTIDCVIFGYYTGKGKRSHFGIGALLVGIYNKDKDCFETIAKIGTGLTDEMWRDVRNRCKALVVKEQPHNVVCAQELYPDVWVDPEIVCVIRADEISRSPLHTAGKIDDEPGYALRFPRFIDYREDKNGSDATTLQEIKHLYNMQFEKKKKR